MKKLMLLGGARYALPVIEAAHKLGIYVITCDYLPNNIAHKYSDEYANVSIIDKEAVLAKAKELEIDGILSFACDPGVDTCYYVAEKMGLPGHPSKSVDILQNKALFRQFLTDNGFNVPKAKGYTNIDEAIADKDLYRWPVIVKPVDSAGSKGVTKVETPDALKDAAEFAIKYSKTDSFIVEEFIQQKGYSSDTDSFSIDGKLVFASFSNQHFDAKANNPYTPSAYSWPSTMPLEIQAELRSELQRLITLLDLKTSVYNIETRMGTDGKPYIMEVSPRGGGNRLSEMLRYATGTDLIINSVRAAVGLPVEGIDGDPIYDGCWAIIILHSDSNGKFVKLDIDESVKSFVVEEDLWVNPGDEVHEFTGANEAIGTLVINCKNHKQVEECLDKVSTLFKVIVE